ncbi:Bifunctional protein BirA [Propionispora sp. 2/2-37]|uniref:biotin--[acetyl-CoA-carboxylase] ligase n=1 Tax=Propionispora sp. 2/2-37 TaxID=1677858 RepID=UPI0006BB858B|nr:biotin--[acetyl-CoA-carboxylase] ligase [Propionispora sp. 2/2-37]CUH96449.1 Bifunctional protein BirA [Propionispora sp. 2/2-37]
MRASILGMLRQHQGQFVSGEEISRQLAVSRTAIWKHIQTLKQEGYTIEAHSRRGYRFEAAPDLLLPDEIKNTLRTEVLGKEVHWFRGIESTSNEAKKLAADGCPEGTLVLAETQQTGRGRLARGWFSPPGKGIWMSLVLRPPFQPQDAPKCTLMAAVAVTKAIRRTTAIACGIKWPNDILYQGKKIVGILTEMSAEMDAVNYVVLGIGINVNIESCEFPREIAPNAVSLAQISGIKISRIELLAAVLRELEQIYQNVVRCGFAEVFQEWRNFSVTLGQEVTVIGLDRQFSGKAVDIDQSGALLVQTSAGMETVLAGDVSLRSGQNSV